MILRCSLSNAHNELSLGTRAGPKYDNDPFRAVCVCVSAVSLLLCIFRSLALQDTSREIKEAANNLRKEKKTKIK